MKFTYMTVTQQNQLKRFTLLLGFCVLLYGAWWFVKWKIFAVPTIRSVSFSPNSRLIAGAGGWVVPHDGDPIQGALWIWDAQSGKKLFRLIAGKEILTVAAFSQDGLTVAAWQTNGKEFLWDASTGRLLRTDDQFLPTSDRIVRENGVLSRNGDLPCVVTSSGCRISPDIEAAFKNKLQQAFKAAGDTFDGNVELLAMQDRGNLIAVSAWSEKNQTVTISVKDIRTGVASSKFSRALSPVRLAKFSPDGNILAIQKRDNRNSLLLWNFKSKAITAMKNETVIFPFSIAFSPHRKLIAEGGLYGEMQLWDTQTGNSIAQWQAN